MGFLADTVHKLNSFLFLGSSDLEIVCFLRKSASLNAQRLNPAILVIILNVLVQCKPALRGCLVVLWLPRVSVLSEIRFDRFQGTVIRNKVFQKCCFKADYAWRGGIYGRKYQATACRMIPSCFQTSSS